MRDRQVYPACGLHESLARFGRFLGVLTLESFSASALGLTVGALAPTPEAALAIGPAVMVRGGPPPPPRPRGATPPTRTTRGRPR